MVRLLIMAAFANQISASGYAEGGLQVPAAQNATTSVAGDPLLAAPPRTWAVDATTNELTVLHHPGSYLRYRLHLHNDKGDQVRDVIESKDGTVARTILREGRPLTKAEDNAERDRLNTLLNTPSDFARHIRNDEKEKKIADDLIRLMPDAMVYTYVPDQPQTGTNHGNREVVMDFEPNPKFKPPTTASQGLTGVKGRVWIDSKSRVVVRIEGNIFQPVNLGWGVLAHIYPGGKVVLEQTNAGGQRWIYTRFTEQINARALLVKEINIRANYDAQGFQVLPGPISYQDAIRMLLDTPLPAN